jgi:hypothetical protein
MNTDPQHTIAIPHHNLNGLVNRNIVQSEVEGGVYWQDLPPGTSLEVITSNRQYRLVKKMGADAWISGHPEFCPAPVLVKLDGSNWGGSMLKRGFIGRGMRLEFRHPVYLTVTTSPIIEIREVA